MGHWISDSMIHKGNRPPPPPVLYLQGLNQNQNLPRPAEAKFYYLHYLLSSDHNYSWNELLTGNKIQLFCVQHQIRLMESRRRTRSNFSAGKSQLLLPTWCSHPKNRCDRKWKLRKWKYEQWPIETKLKSISLQVITKWTLLLLPTIILKMIKIEKSANAATANIPRFGWVIWESMWKPTWE